MKKHVMYVGLLDQETKTQLVSKRDAIQTIANVVGDCTISDAYGYYTHEDGSKIEEPSLRVEMLFKTDEEVFKFGSKIKKALNQESIGLDIQETNCMLI